MVGLRGISSLESGKASSLACALASGCPHSPPVTRDVREPNRVPTSGLLCFSDLFPSETSSAGQSTGFLLCRRGTSDSEERCPRGPASVARSAGAGRTSLRCCRLRSNAAAPKTRRVDSRRFGALAVWVCSGTALRPWVAAARRRTGRRRDASVSLSSNAVLQTRSCSRCSWCGFWGPWRSGQTPAAK